MVALAVQSTDPAIALAETDASRQGAPKHDQIVDGAARVFAQDGYEGASMSRIAAEAGVSKGTLYNYFAGKAELFAAHVQRECGRKLSLVFDDLDHAAPPAVVLSQIGTRMLSMMLSEPSLVMHRMVVAEAVKFPELAETFHRAGPAKALAHLAAYLRQAGKQEWLAVEDSEFAAEQFFALIQARLYFKRQLRLIAMPSDAQMAQVVGGAVALFMRGYGRG